VQEVQTNEMKYELAKQLKEAGFPQSRKYGYETMMPEGFDSHGVKAIDFEAAKVNVPTLSELIEACGESFRDLSCYHGAPDDQWEARGLTEEQERGSSPEVAVANLWLALNSKNEK
jgi:hypothetical protein